MSSPATTAVEPQHSILSSTFPVYLPHIPELLTSDIEFVKYLDSLNTSAKTEAKAPVPTKKPKVEEPKAEESPFVKALTASSSRVHTTETLAAENKTLTENADVAFISSQNALVDLFYGLSGTDNDTTKLTKTLEDAWEVDALATLKIIFNARSIHLGKSDRAGAYKALAWLYETHTMTLLVNLPWLVRPVIPKPTPKKKKEEEKSSETKTDAKESQLDDDDDFEIVAAPEGPAFDNVAVDRKNGMAHGYWKDLLNLLALAAEDKFKPSVNPTTLLNERPHVAAPTPKRRKKSRPDGWLWNQEEAKAKRHKTRDDQNSKVCKMLESDENYRLLHLSVARLFAAQLRRDLTLLNSSDLKAKFRISLAAKWAPSLKEFHDKHTFVTSSIAEILFTHEEVCPATVPKTDRTTYLKHARAAYQFRVLSPLRKAIDVVERHISDNTFNAIKYEKVPSLAMSRYQSLFIKKDEDHFNKYLDAVATGGKAISGAVMLPGVLVSKVKDEIYAPYNSKKKTGVAALAEKRVADLQWNSLVERVKATGKLESSIGVCDVSGSMSMPQFKDGTNPMDSSIGLSLLLAEICDGPFGGVIITFSEVPEVVKVGGSNDKRTLTQKVGHLLSAQVGYSTNFVAVFSDLILPIAKEHKLKQEDMVKQVFVFSDMQFNEAEGCSVHRWSSSFERIKEEYAKAGYEMPTLIFWNLADETKGVPVECDVPGTALVGGYSQGSMKVFLDGGGFEDQEEVEVKDKVVEKGEGEEGVVAVEKEKKKITPMSTVRKAISHEAYSMLKVVD